MKPLKMIPTLLLATLVTAEVVTASTSVPEITHATKANLEKLSPGTQLASNDLNAALARGYIPAPYPFLSIPRLNLNVATLNLLIGNQTVYPNVYDLSKQSFLQHDFTYSPAIFTGFYGDHYFGTNLTRLYDNDGNRFFIPQGLPTTFNVKHDHAYPEAMPAGDFYAQPKTDSLGTLEVIVAETADRRLLHYRREDWGNALERDQYNDICPENGCSVISVSTRVKGVFQKPLVVTSANDPILNFTFDPDLTRLVVYFIDDNNKVFLQSFDLESKTPDKATRIDIQTSDIVPIDVREDGKTIRFLYPSGDNTCMTEVDISSTRFIPIPNQCHTFVSDESISTGSLRFSASRNFAVLPCSYSFMEGGEGEDVCYDFLYSVKQNRFWRIDEVKGIGNYFDNYYGIHLEAFDASKEKPDQLSIGATGTDKNTGNKAAYFFDISLPDTAHH